jgi:hypothetical protein
LLKLPKRRDLKGKEVKTLERRKKWKKENRRKRKKTTTSWTPFEPKFQSSKVAEEESGLKRKES